MRKYFKISPVLSPRKGYARWAESYESPGNLMHLLDEQICRRLLAQVDLSGKTILDYGCGTGRHWDLLEQFQPAGVVGCDPSPEMLAQLRRKRPEAGVYLLRDHAMPFQPDHSIDLLFSTLVIGHISRLEAAFLEWDRVVKRPGYLLFTGNHPAALQAGVKRTFAYRNKSYAIRNHIHSFDKIRRALQRLDWLEAAFLEISIGGEHRSFYEAYGALASFERVKGMPVVYGMFWERR